MRLSSRKLATLVVAGAALTAAGCGFGSDDGGGDGSSTGANTPDYTALAKGAPKPLAKNIKQANVIIDGGQTALEEKLADLRGHPVVVNQWASWCDPCRAEFPWFADSAEQHAKDVAFVGIDMQDERGAAEEWLEELPVPYPHIFDPDAGAITSIGGGQASPTTVFVDEKGEIVQVRPGQYASQAELEADIDQFLLRG